MIRQTSVHEEQVAQAIQKHHGQLGGRRVVVTQSHATTLGSAANVTCEMKSRGDARATGQDESLELGHLRIGLVDRPFEQLDIVGTNALRRSLLALRRRRELGSKLEEQRLDGAQVIVQLGQVTGPSDERAREPELRIELVHGAVGFDPNVVFGDAAAAEQTGLSTITRLRIDARRHSVPKSSTSRYRGAVKLNRLEHRILRTVYRACKEFSLLKPNDKILVALSGGKDSYALAWALKHIQSAAPFKFDLVAYHLDQGQPGHNTHPIEGHMKELGVPYEVEYQDTYTRVVEKTEPGKIYCSLCSRFRRAILYKAAQRHGCNKVALGHHADDLAETVLLNMFFAGQIKTMPPKLVSEDGSQELIRPLVYVPEAELIQLSDEKQFPVVPCKLCGSQEAQRKAVKNLLSDLEQRYPDKRIKQSILASLGNVRTSHMLDKALHPYFNEGGAGDFLEAPAEPEAPKPVSALPLISAAS
jgi:tRNA 2-thiocytidine biosynthesis protein TtcA